MDPRFYGDDGSRWLRNINPRDADVVFTGCRGREQDARTVYALGH